MNFSQIEPKAKKIKFDDNTMWIELHDGRCLGVPLAYFPRLHKAKSSQLRRYIISGGGKGIHWDDLDEDISVDGLLLGRGDIHASQYKTKEKSRA